MAVCANCGEWTEPPVIEEDSSSRAFVICPHCHHRAPFTRRPLWWIAGSPGAGKTALTPLLRRRLPDCVVFEGEAIDFWRFEGTPGEYASLYNQWLKVTWEIALNDVPVVFLGIALPEQLDACTFRSRFSAVHFLGLVCDAPVQAARLQARPAWRRADSPEFIRQARGFTDRRRELGRRDGAAMTLVDTTTSAPEESAARIAAWVRERLRQRPADGGR